MLKEPVERMRSAFSHCLAASLAGALAYWAARYFFGHPQPVFAAIAALICLGPGIPNHLVQGRNMLVGMTTGILIGELALRPQGSPAFGKNRNRSGLDQAPGRALSRKYH